MIHIKSIPVETNLPKKTNWDKYESVIFDESWEYVARALVYAINEETIDTTNNYLQIVELSYYNKTPKP